MSNRRQGNDYCGSVRFSWGGQKRCEGWQNNLAYFLLDKPNGRWRVAGVLPVKSGYGVSVTWKNHLICAGGSNEAGHLRKVFAVSYQAEKLAVDTLPDLPFALANSSGAIAGNIFYVAGGITSLDDKRCSTAFLSLDLSLPASKQHWRMLDTWPGPPRMLAVAGSIDNSFYLFSGAELVDAGNGTSKRRYLDDAYKYEPSKGWHKLAKMPWPAVAAPTPVYASGESMLIIFGGDDGQLAERADLKETHPGFNVHILNYLVKKNQWEVSSNIPVSKNDNSITNPNESLWAPVTVSSVIWNGKIVFPGGEVRPAVRTPRVRVATPVKR
ncbi:galactose oxidase [Mucilaginibacter sp. CSA2-8R]|uniref:galactose oxidase n=1 Tax=Mucilaginibacter sp. CSA2-8R TaxID=3141542 RepID=UPI00315D1323